MERGKLLISKDYWPNKPIKINLEAPNFNLEQIQFRESYLKAHYKNKQIFIDKFFSKLIEGNIEVEGKIETGNENIFNNCSQGQIIIISIDQIFEFFVLQISLK